MSLKAVIAVDFDGTLCESRWPAIGEPNMAVIDWLKQKREEGWLLILWTCRDGELLNRAVEWCETFGLQFDAVNDNVQERKDFYGNNSRKVSADIYIDDRNENPGTMFPSPDPLFEDEDDDWMMDPAQCGYQYHEPRKRLRDRIRTAWRTLWAG